MRIARVPNVMALGTWLVLLAGHVVGEEVVLPAKEQFHLFLLVGQSNMAGRGAVAAEDRVPHSRVLMLTKDQRWVPAVDPMHFDKPAIVGVGLGRTFGIEIAQADPAITVGLVPCAVGGSPIASWAPGAHYAPTKSRPYDDAIARARHAMQFGTLKGILWHQGEADSRPGAAQGYQDKLGALVARFRQDLSAPDVPFLVGQMGQFDDRPWNDAQRAVDAAHRTLPGKLPGTAVVSSQGLTHAGDGVHFDARSYREFGARYARALRAIRTGQPADSRPNILVVLLDDVRWDDIGASGHPWVRTPHFDRIAREGAMFRNAFAATPLCSPSRASILTGQYAHSHGIIDNVDRRERSHALVTFPRLLHAAGYETAYIGKWHMGVDDSPRPGFDDWFSLEGQGYYFDPQVNDNGRRRQVTGYTTDIFTDRAIEFLRRRRDKPFLLYLAHKAVHPNVFQNADGSVRGDLGGAEQFTPAPRHQDLYGNEPIPRRPNTRSYGAGKPALLRPLPGVEPLGPTTGTDDASIRNRLRMLASADEGMGRIFEVLDQTGALDQTVIVMTSDHGYFYGEHGLGRERRLAYEESVRVPLFVRYPPLVRPGTTIDALTVNVDLAPTMIELARVDIPKALHGRSLVPWLRGETPADWRHAILIEYFSDGVMPRVVRMGYQAVRTSDWKYVHYVELEGMDELYDLKSDPYEMKNVIGDPATAPALGAMKAELAQLLQATGP